jgi:hypothetical protein
MDSQDFARLMRLVPRHSSGACRQPKEPLRILVTQTLHSCQPRVSQRLWTLTLQHQLDENVRNQIDCM